MKADKSVSMPEKPSQSTLLFGSHLNETILKPRGMKGKILALYLHRLMSDPNLEYKLSFLKPKKWKKGYQEAGQDLVPVYFFPDDCDWARLSIISYASGFSRCYIFVYLMLLDLGILKLPENITIENYPKSINITKLICCIMMDERKKILRRTLKT